MTTTYNNAAANLARAEFVCRFDRATVARTSSAAEQFEAVRRLHEAIRNSGAKIRSKGMASATRAMELILREARS